MSCKKNEEGIIIKKLNSVYSPNDRGMDWVKLKSEYMEGMTDTLDLIVIGGYFGEGRVRIGVRKYFLFSNTIILSIKGRRLDRSCNDIFTWSIEICE